MCVCVCVCVCILSDAVADIRAPIRLFTLYTCVRTIGLIRPMSCRTNGP